MNIKAYLENYPRLYLGLLRLKRFRHWSRDWIVSAQTDITIEGFPRSGNSFARSAFRSAEEDQGGSPHKIATHVHSHAQIIRSAQLGIPTMVLLRAPRDACLSLVALGFQIEDANISEKRLARAKLDLINVLAAYRRFYENVLKVKDQVIIADFNLVTTNYAEVIRRMNCRYGTHFPLYENNADNESKVFKEGGFHLSPNSKRDDIKATLNRYYSLDELQPSIADAQATYEKLLKIEQEQAARYQPIEA